MENFYFIMVEQFSTVSVCVYIYICIYIFLIHSSISRHLGCFYILAIVNNATVNTGVHLSYWISGFVFFG